MQFVSSSFRLSFEKKWKPSSQFLLRVPRKANTFDSNAKNGRNFATPSTEGDSSKKHKTVVKQGPVSTTTGVTEDITAKPKDTKTVEKKIVTLFSAIERARQKNQLSQSLNILVKTSKEKEKMREKMQDRGKVQEPVVTDHSQKALDMMTNQRSARQYKPVEKTSISEAPAFSRQSISGDDLFVGTKFNPFSKKERVENNNTQTKEREFNDVDDEKKGRRTRTEKYEDRIKELKEGTPRPLILNGEMSIKGIAQSTSIKATDLAKELIKVGEVPETANSIIHFDVIDLILSQYNFICIRNEALEEENDLLEQERLGLKDKMIPRPPIVAIMGHINHGKTSLLDALRGSRLVDKEVGKITQLTAGFSVTTPTGGRITFVDTPGHEAFSTMRSKTAKMVDAIVLVVAGDEGVKEQTIEAIQYIQEAKKPLIIAVNKSDKPNFDMDRIRQQLFQYNIVTRQDGGDVEMVKISALTGKGLDDLENTILYTAEELHLKDDPNAIVQGTVVETKFNKGKGPMAMVIIEKGTLKIGDYFVSGLCHGKVKNLFDDYGKPITEASLSQAVSVMGMNQLALQGDDFLGVKSGFIAKETVFLRERKRARTYQQDMAEQLKIKEYTSKEDIDLVGPLHEIKLVIKAATANSLQALCDSIQALPQGKVNVNIISVGVGPISDSDITFADMSKAILVSFDCPIATQVYQTAKEQEIKLFHSSKIYTLIHEVKEQMIGKLEPPVTYIVEAEAMVKQVFEIGKSKEIIGGCKVVSGNVVKKLPAQVKRGEDIVWRGNIESIRHHKESVNEINSGMECGIQLEGFTELMEGDIIQTYTTKTSRPQL